MWFFVPTAPESFSGFFTEVLTTSRGFMTDNKGNTYTKVTEAANEGMGTVTIEYLNMCCNYKTMYSGNVTTATSSELYFGIATPAPATPTPTPQPEWALDVSQCARTFQFVRVSNFLRRLSHATGGTRAHKQVSKKQPIARHIENCPIMPCSFAIAAIGNRASLVMPAGVSNFAQTPLRKRS